LTRVIGIASGKGGVGKTTLATNLAIALNKFGKRVIVIDCNLTTPHLSYYLGVEDFGATINDILKGKTDIRYAVSHYNGVMFIPASLNLKDLINIDLSDLKSHLERLDLPFIDFVFLDCAPGLGREAISVLKIADEVIFISTPTVPTLMDVKRCIDVLRKKNKKFSLVLNMVGCGKYEFKKVEHVYELLKIPVLGSIPFDRNVVDSVAFGVPLLKMKPNSKAGLAFMKLAANLIGIEYKVYPSPFHRIAEKIKEKLFRK